MIFASVFGIVMLIALTVCIYIFFCKRERVNKKPKKNKVIDISNVEAIENQQPTMRHLKNISTTTMEEPYSSRD